MRALNRGLQDYRRRVNVGSAERIASTLLGLAFISAGLGRRRLTGMMLGLGGVGLIKRGLSGHCVLYDRLKTTDARPGRGAKGRRPTERMRQEIEVERFEGEGGPPATPDSAPDEHAVPEKVD